jgi:hypothetical protein
MSTRTDPMLTVEECCECGHFRSAHRSLLLIKHGRVWAELRWRGQCGHSSCTCRGYRWRQSVLVTNDGARLQEFIAHQAHDHVTRGAPQRLQPLHVRPGSER